MLDFLLKRAIFRLQVVFSLKSLLLALAIATPAIADQKVFGDGSLPKFLKDFDTNGDGVIDEEERQAIRDLRAKLRESKRKSIDLNQDGEISPDEIQLAREALRAQIEERRLEKFSDIAGEDFLISPEEYATIPGMNTLPDVIFEAIWSRLDSDGNGAISADEFLLRLRTHNE